MKNVLKSLFIASGVIFHLLGAMETTPTIEDRRLSECPESCKPAVRRWLSACDRISEIANERIIPLLALQTSVGNDNPRTLTEWETESLKEWQELQDTINTLALSILDLMTQGTDNKNYTGRINISRDKQRALRLIIKEFSSFSPSSIVFPPKLCGQRPMYGENYWDFSEEEVLQVCRQRCLGLYFEIKGLETELGLVTQQIADYTGRLSTPQEIITKLTLESLALERKLAAANAEKTMASGNIELLGLITHLSKISEDSWKGTVFWRSTK